MEIDIKELKNYLRSQGACELIDDKTDVAGLVEVMRSGAGIEYCCNSEWAMGEVFGRVGRDVCRRYGVYHGEAFVSFKNKPFVVVSGGSAILRYDSVDCPFVVVVIGRAKVKGVAEGYAVVGLHCSKRAEVEIIKKDFAKVGFVKQEAKR